MRALTLALCFLAVLLPASGGRAEALYNRNHPEFLWDSPDGATRYRIGGSGVQLLDCMASAMAYHEAARRFRAKQTDAEWQADHDRLVAEWQGIMADFLASVPDRVPPEEFPRAATLRIEKWRGVAADMAQLSVMGRPNDGTLPLNLQAAADHYAYCDGARRW